MVNPEKVHNISLTENKILGAFPHLKQFITAAHQLKISWAIANDSALWLLLTELPEPSTMKILVKEHDLHKLDEYFDKRIQQKKAGAFSAHVISLGNVELISYVTLEENGHTYSFSLTDDLLKQCTTLQWGNLMFTILSTEDLLLMNLIINKASAAAIDENVLLKHKINFNLNYLASRIKQLKLSPVLKEKCAKICL